MMTSAQIRKSFLDFFRERGHAIVPSSPVVLPSDPTLLFTNAGMNQFKDIFLGRRTIATPRVANTQKCIRVSGKHNDLEEVGLDTYHHTFFEMLGNWSFGDYYKREAIAWAWELLTQVWKLPRERLWATVYRDDDEAEALWREVTDIPPDHILRFGEKDNFWEMGDTGPCGPCSEIHIDRTPNGCGPELINAGTPDVIELWNLVFIQYNRRADGSLEELPAKHVDTGMGFERLVAVLQGHRSNYDTDLFRPLIERISALSQHEYDGPAAVAMRVIADHLRALSFAIADGVLPSNEGRGYVLRRLLRRAARYARKIGLREPFMAELFPILENILGDTFPELRRHREEIMRAITAEEETFAAALDRGIAVFEEAVQRVRAQGSSTFPGDDAFKLYDTYGFPLDLTLLMAAEQNLTVDQARFDELMEQQRERARAAQAEKLRRSSADWVNDLVRRGVRSAFTGYERLTDEAEILALFGAGTIRDELREGEEGEILLDHTPFYAESGGQIGDRGLIRGPEGEFEVWDTQRPAEGIIVHIGRVVQGRLAAGHLVAALVDAARRQRTARHHTATHLLQFALREIVSPYIKQAGSYVAPDRLRFDFSYFEKVPDGQLEEVERRINAVIRENAPVKTYWIPFSEVHGSGIIALFDEKYGDTVRVVEVTGYSRELCGGTHVTSTGQLGLFRIVAEGSVATGVRRIEALCGEAAYEWTRREHRLIEQLSRKLSAAPEDLPTRLENLLEEQKRLTRELKEQATASALSRVSEWAARARRVGDVTLVVENAGEQSADVLRAVMDALREKVPSGVIVLGAQWEGKALFLANISEDCVARGLHAGRLLNELARITGGGGGGQAARAQAGGKDPSKLDEALARVPELITRAITS